MYVFGDSPGRRFGMPVLWSRSSFSRTRWRRLDSCACAWCEPAVERLRIALRPREIVLDSAEHALSLGLYVPGRVGRKLNDDLYLALRDAGNGWVVVAGARPELEKVALPAERNMNGNPEAVDQRGCAVVADESPFAFVPNVEHAPVRCGARVTALGVSAGAEYQDVNELGSTPNAWRRTRSVPRATSTTELGTLIVRSCGHGLVSAAFAVVAEVTARAKRDGYGAVHGASKLGTLIRVLPSQLRVRSSASLAV